MRSVRILISIAVVSLLVGAALPAVAQEEGEEEQPTTPVPTEFGMTTPYPQVAVQAGDQATFDLSIVAPQPTNATLTVDSLPDGWTAVFRGGGFEIDGVTAGPDAPEVSLDVSVPAETEEGAYDIGVTAEAGNESVSLPLQVRVSAVAGGEVTLTPDFPGLRVPAGETASFSLELRNDTPADLEFELSATGPAGWDVIAEPASEAQATTIQVEAGGTETINVDATSPVLAEARQYPISVQATAPDQEVQSEMVVEIVGSFSLDLATPDERLSTEVSGGGSTEVQLVVTNSGTAPIRNIEMSSTPPSEWDVVFAEPTIAELGAGESVNAIATVTPSDQAIAGDYVITFSANSEQANSEVDIRTTVNPSALWGFIGIALIALTLAGLAWVFRRFGRR